MKNNKLISYFSFKFSALFGYFSAFFCLPDPDGDPNPRDLPKYESVRIRIYITETVHERYTYIHK